MKIFQLKQNTSNIQMKLYVAFQNYLKIIKDCIF